MLLMNHQRSGNVAGAQKPAERTEVPDASSDVLKGKHMTAEQIQSAIERAQKVVDSMEPSRTYGVVAAELAQALLDVHGRLQEAEKRVPITGEHWRAVVELSAYAADGPRLINELTGDYIRMRSQSESSFEAAKQWNAVAEQLRAELTEARKELEEEHRRSDELSAECEDHAFLVAKVKRVIGHVAGDAGINSGAQFDSLMADVRDLATVTINEQTQVADTLQRSLTEARRQLEMMREAFEELQQITPTETPNAAL